MPPDHPLSVHRALGLLSLVILSWGANWPVTKIIVRDISPAWSTAFRCVIAAMTLAILLFASRRFLLPKKGDVPVVLSIALLHMSAFSILVAAGLQFLPAGRAIVLGYTTPIWVTIGARLFLGERMTRRKAIGVIMGLAGLGIIFSFFDGLGGMAIITAWWGIWHIVSGLSLALFWSKRDPCRYPRFAHRHH